MIKQIDSYLLPGIRREGCSFLCDLSIAEDIALKYNPGFDAFQPAEINGIYELLSGKYINAFDKNDDDGCYVYDHPHVIRQGLYVLGVRESLIDYRYRQDGKLLVVGRPESILDCNYYVKVISLPDCGYHHIRCDVQGKALYNPGVHDSDTWTSFRAFKVSIRYENPVLGSYFWS